MAESVYCDIVSAEEKIFSGKVSMIVATATQGQIGILPGHTPMLTGIEPGPVKVTTENGEESYFASGGYLEVQPNHVTILADTALRAKDMDEAAAEEARKEAERALANKESELDYTRAAAQLAEATAQIRMIQNLRKKVR